MLGNTVWNLPLCSALYTFLSYSFLSHILSSYLFVGVAILFCFNLVWILKPVWGNVGIPLLSVFLCNVLSGLWFTGQKFCHAPLNLTQWLQWPGWFMAVSSHVWSWQTDSCDVAASFYSPAGIFMFGSNSLLTALRTGIALPGYHWEWSLW